MKNSIKSLVVMAIIAIAGTTFAQSTGNSASATGTANATIVCPISLTAGTITFGTFVSPAAATTVSLDNAGVATYGAGTNPGSQGGAHSASTWNVTGQGGWTYNLTDDATRAFTISDGAGHTMTGNANAPSGSNPRTLAGDGCNGTGSFTQGGTVNVGAGQVSGTYSTGNSGGSGWSETVTYN